MKTKRTFRSRRAFTLVELLVVISIIGILAAMLLPVLNRVKVKARVKLTEAQMAQIVRAISEYESAYSRFPVSTPALQAAVNDPSHSDFTFGTFGLPGIKKPDNTLYDIKNPPTMTFNTNNAELMAILMDLEKFPNGADTINKGHVKNPQKGAMLVANMVSDNTSPGVGLDGVYRDLWGNPFIISMDLNNDNKCRDAFYCDAAVSATAAPGTPGLNGLIPTATAPYFYEANGPIMVWSAGPDGRIQPASGANLGANKDNVLSWK